MRSRRDRMLGFSCGRPISSQILLHWQRDSVHDSSSIPQPRVMNHPRILRYRIVHILRSRSVSLLGSIGHLLGSTRLFSASRSGSWGQHRHSFGCLQPWYINSSFSRTCSLFFPLNTYDLSTHEGYIHNHSSSLPADIDAIRKILVSNIRIKVSEPHQNHELGQPRTSCPLSKRRTPLAMYRPDQKGHAVWLQAI